MTGILIRRGSHQGNICTEEQSREEAARGWPFLSQGERPGTYLSQWPSEETKLFGTLIFDLQAPEL